MHSLGNFGRGIGRKRAKPRVRGGLPRVMVVVSRLTSLVVITPKRMRNTVYHLTRLTETTKLRLVLTAREPSMGIVAKLVGTGVPSQVTFSMSSNISSEAVVSVGNTRGLLKGKSVLFCPSKCPGPIEIRKSFISSRRIRGIISCLVSGGKGASCDGRLRRRVSDDTSLPNRKVLPKRRSDRGDESICFTSTKGLVVSGRGTSVNVLREVFGVNFGHTTEVVSRLYRTNIMNPRRKAGPEGILVAGRRFTRCVRGRASWGLGAPGIVREEKGSRGECSSYAKDEGRARRENDNANQCFEE